RLVTRRRGSGRSSLGLFEAKKPGKRQGAKAELAQAEHGVASIEHGGTLRWQRGGGYQAAAAGSPWRGLLSTIAKRTTDINSRPTQFFLEYLLTTPIVCSTPASQIRIARACRR